MYELQSYKPKSKLLEKYVDFYYVFSQERSENISYIAFPHVNTAISFFKGVEIIRGDYEININTENQHKSKCVVEILGKYTRPVFVNYFGNCEEVAIVFKPLGVNIFFQNDLIELSPVFSQELKNIHWTEFSHELLNEKSIPKKIELLDTFLINNLNTFENEKMYEAIKYLEDFDSNYSIDKVSTLCGFTLKTFQRNFSKHLTCSPLEYKRISRFRHSLENKLISKEIKTLTSISNDSNYYDQSYFIREFKKLTHINPKKFFDSIIALNEKKIVWKVK
jgi:AraC-like DNA-binding protein